jgi:putative endonuclease
MSTAKRNLGKWGENRASRYLESNHYEILAHNVRTPYGELDIVAMKDDVVVFVEVKTRSTKSYGFPEDSVTPTKKEHLMNAAQSFLVDHPELGTSWQIDVVSVRKLGRQKIEITHFENAFSE